VVLVLITGEPSGDAVTDVVARLTSAVSAGCGSRLVVVMDAPELNLVRRAGMVVEYLMPRRVLAERFPDLSHETYLAERLAGLTRDYATRQLVTLAPDQPLGLQELSQLLRPPAAGRARRLIRRATARTELFLDRSTFNW
jgi:hypothetical protein